MALQALKAVSLNWQDAVSLKPVHPAHIIGLLNDKDWRLRQHVPEILKQLIDLKCVARDATTLAVAEALKDSRGFVRLGALATFRRLGAGGYLRMDAVIAMAEREKVPEIQAAAEDVLRLWGIF